MRWLIALRVLAGICAAWASAVTAAPQAWYPSEVAILAYHDISDNNTQSDPDAVSVQQFSDQMLWLKASGYNIISVEDYFQYRKGVKALPPKPVMLTFDDGYLSFYTHAFPILRALGFPSQLAIVGSWVDRGTANTFALSRPLDINGIKLPLMSPDQIKEVSDSGLVEISSHTYNLHYGGRANPQGSTLPASSVRIFDKVYEDEAAYRARVTQDLQRNSAWLKSVTGKAPRTVVWPYGRFTSAGILAASQTGHPISFGLNRFNWRDSEREVLGRFYPTGSLTLGWFQSFVEAATTPTKQAIRRHISLQASADIPPGGFSEEWAGNVIQAAADSGASHVMLSPIQGTGGACKSLAPSTVLPVAADTLTFISWQLHRRADVTVLLDINTSQCALSEAQWIQYVAELVSLVPLQGLLVRAPVGQEKLAQTLMDLAYRATPAAILVSNLPGLKQMFQLKSISACTSAPDRMSVQPTLQFEVSSEGCGAAAQIRTLGLARIKNFGVNPGTISSSGKLAGIQGISLMGITAPSPP